MIGSVTIATAAALLAAQPAFAQDTTAPAPAAAPAAKMSLAEKLAIAAGVIGAGVVAVKALKGNKQQAAGQPMPASGTTLSSVQPAAGQPVAQ